MKTVVSHNPSLVKEFIQFTEHWNKLKLGTVKVGGLAQDFREVGPESCLSMLLPNTQKAEGSGMLVVGVMITLANLQNEMIYLAKMIENPDRSLDEIVKDEKDSLELVQTIQKDDLIYISSKIILEEIRNNGYIHNYDRRKIEKGMRILYDFEEIETRLYQLINNKKKLLNNEKFIQMCYRMELYPENISIITDIRRKTPQIEMLQEDKRLKINFLRENFSGPRKRDLLEYLGSLDYIFTYLCNVNADGSKTIEDFCTEWKLNSRYLNEYVRREPLSKVPLNQILDFYETVEEVVYDEVFRGMNQNRFAPEDTNERDKILRTFEQATLHNQNENLHPKLKNPDILVKVFKRIILRGLISQFSADNSLQAYFVRPDMWSQDINISHINQINLNESIKLKHSYIILEYLERVIESRMNLQSDIYENDENSQSSDESELYHRISREESSERYQDRYEGRGRRRQSDSDESD